MNLNAVANDEIIKRRLAQKMNFLAEDIAALQNPSDDELRSWFGRNSSRFAMPARASFHHLYFSSDRGPGARDAAAAALSAVMPADLLQKVILVAIFTAACTGAARLLGR